LGLAASLELSRDNPAWQTPPGELMPENSGKLEDLVMHYTAGAYPIVGQAYSDFLSRLDSTVKVRMLVPELSAFQELIAKLPKLNCKLEPLVTHFEITPWSRDRWLALSDSPPSTLLFPKTEKLADVWPARAGDGKVASLLAARLPLLEAHRSMLYFDGGDFMPDGKNVFVTPSVAALNIQKSVVNEGELLSALTQLLKKKVILLKHAPDHHAGMFMMMAKDHTVLVSDPALGARLLKDSPMEPGLISKLLPMGMDTSTETQVLYDEAANLISQHGYRVLRVPSLHGLKSRVYISYVNVIQDFSTAGAVVYLPTFQGLSVLNEAASKIWSGLGYEVRPVDASNLYQHGGTIHCLVNVLKRSPGMP
jgi:hypothetical protein